MRRHLKVASQKVHRGSGAVEHRYYERQFGFYFPEPNIHILHNNGGVDRRVYDAFVGLAQQNEVRLAQDPNFPMNQQIFIKGYVEA